MKMMKKVASLIQTDQSTCAVLDDNLFAVSDKVTILTDYPASITQEPNEFENKNPGLFTKIKNVISGWISSSKSDDEDTAPQIKLKEGTYTCAGNSCTRIPGDESISYERIKEVLLFYFSSPNDFMLEKLFNSVKTFLFLGLGKDY